MNINIIRAVMMAARKSKKFLWVLPLAAILTIGGITFAATATITLPFDYHFISPGTLHEASSAASSGSPYWWVATGGYITIANGIGETPQGTTASGSTLQKTYAASYPTASDNGAHPQNLFQMFLKDSIADPAAQIYFRRVKDNLVNTANRSPFIGESVIARYQGSNTFYIGSIRADGLVVIKKKVNGAYTTLAQKKILPGTYDKTTNYDLIPLNEWIGLKLSVTDTSSGPQLALYTDIGRTGTWSQALSVVDDPNKFGATVSGTGLVGVRSDFADAQFDDFQLTDPAPSSGVVAATLTTTASASPAPAPAPAPTTSSGTYDSVVLADNPVMYLKMNSANSGKETDATGHGHNGTYMGGTPSSTSLPNGDGAALFNGTSQYLTVPSSAALSIPTTKMLTWEAWIRPDVANFSTASSDGYVDWMGKCENYSPSCEWEARIYSDSTAQGRPYRLSAYVFNPSAGLGSAADWQPNSSWIPTGKWIHVVAEYQTVSTPSGCDSAQPGTINVWVDGVEQSFASHAPTGCMSQYQIVPKAGSSPLDIGTMAMDTWFKGAIGKVAIYDHLLTQSQINAHFKAMSGKDPSGSCGATCTAVMP